MSIDDPWGQNPLVVIWEVTRACALACRHCRGQVIAHCDPRELDLAEAERFIGQVKRAEPGLFILTGGDLVYRRDLVHIIECAAKQGLRVAMSPSATPRFLKAGPGMFRDAGLKEISLGIDGATRTTHDSFRRVPGAWDWAMRACRSVRDAGLGLQINTIVSRWNIGEIEGFLPLLEELKPQAWTLFPLVPTGRAKAADMISGEQAEELFNRLCELEARAGCKIKTVEGMHYRRVALQRWKRAGGRQPAVGSINDGKGSVFVSHTGEIHPGAFLPIPAGNVRTEELLDVYRNAPLFRRLRDPRQLRGKCGRCEFNDICGGSRARAFAMTGDYLAEEPLCIYQPGKSAAD